MGKNRIRLQVSASVSGKGAKATACLVDLNTRGFSSTVELHEGETLAVAGLIQTHGNMSRGLVSLFRPGANERELVILVTPEFVHRAPPAPPAAQPAPPQPAPLSAPRELRLPSLSPSPPGLRVMPGL
jgi:Flp pilus assembly secretin CpaC